MRGFVVLGTALALAASAGPVAAQAATSNVAARSSAAQRLNPKPNLHIMPTKNSAAARASNGAVKAAAINLSYYGGPVMQAGTQTIPIFWEPPTLQDGTSIAPAAGYNSLLTQFFQDIGGYGYYNIMTQYYQVVSGNTQYIVNSSGFLQAIVDTNAYPAAGSDCLGNAVNCITDTQLQAKIANIVTNGSLPTNYSTGYFVFTDPMEASCASPTQCFNPENYNSFVYCAYHGEFALGGDTSKPVIYANMPYVDSEFISNLLCGLGGNATGNQDVDDETVPLSHEFMEMVTDPNADASGWYDFAQDPSTGTDYGEIGDICAGDGWIVPFGAHDFVVQAEYSNFDAACVPGGPNTLSLTSSTGSPGSATTVNGTGFTANHSVALSFSDASGTVISLGSATSNGTGAFSQLVTIPSGSTNGLGTLGATGANPGDGASAGFTVSGSGPTTYVLTVSKAGSGSGSVGSSPAGINCGATCQYAFNSGDSVTLTATASTGSTFTGWSGSGCSGTGTCIVSMTQARPVTATFSLNTYALTVSKNGTGSGSVGSSPAGISCGATCAHSFNYNTSVTLTATASTGSTFTGWSGAGCSGTGTCNVSMTTAQAVTATFTLNTYALTVSKSGAGIGGVTSSPAGIDCGGTCQFSFDYNTSVTLTATADSGSTFTGWSGSGCSGTGTCNVSMTQARSVTANFTIIGTFNLTVSKAGNGSGGVTSSPGAIDCGATCQDAFNSGDSVTLTATADAGSTFTGWSGAGCSGTGTCIVSMTQAQAVTATFALSYLPDGLLSYNTGGYVGNGIYNTTGASQVRAVSISRGHTATFHWRVQNDGAASDHVLLSGAAGTAAFTVNFFSGTTNVTAAVVAGTYARTLAPGAAFSLIVKIGVATKAAIGAVRNELLTVRSTNQPVSDAVLARVTAK